jgi:hypothetical protein
MKTAGIAVLIIGVLLTIFTSFKFFTKEKVVDVGKFEINREKPHKANWSPLLGVGVMAIGGIMLFYGAKKA